MAATNTQAWALTDTQRALLEGWLAEFERTWDEGRLAARVRELPAGPLRFPALVELVKIDLERSWQKGTRVTVESYLGAYPELGTPDTVPADLLQAECEVRQRHGEDMGLTGYAARFPGRVEDLRRLLERQPDSEAVANLSTLRQAAEPAATDTARLEPEVARLERLGRYRMVRKLGRGGMGSVYLVEDTRLDRLVALKVPRFATDDGPEVRERFYREARAAGGLHHPNICPVYDVGEVEGVPYLTMAYLEGAPLSERLAAGPPPSPPQAAALVRQLARALEVAHGHGIVHRDLKPGNVMMGPTGEPVIMDFGLARRAGKGDIRLTQSGALMGTPAYMSPEQAAGDPAAVGPGSDVYSLGVMLYELVTGRLPFAGTLADVLWQIRTEEPKRPSALRPDLNPQLEGIIMRAMAKTVEKRYASAGEFAEALDDYLRQEETQPGPANRLAPYLPSAADTPKGKRPRMRGRWLWPVVGVFALAAVGLVLAVLWRWGTAGGSSDRDQPTAQEESSRGGGGGPTGRTQPTGREEKPPKPQAPVVIKAPEKRLDTWVISPDGKTLVRVFGEDVEVWDADTGKLRVSLKGPGGNSKDIDFSPDSRFLAVGGYRRVKVWDLKDNKELAEFKESKENVVRLLFFPDGKRLLGVDHDGSAWVWDVAAGKVLKDRKVGSLFGRGPWYLPRGRTTVLTGPGLLSTDFSLLNIEDLTTKNITIKRSVENVHHVTFFPDGKRLLLGEGDDVTVCDMGGAEPQPVHHRHTKAVYMVGLSPDGKLAASGSEDKTAVVWDLEAKKERATYKGFDGPVGVRFSPDGKTLLAWTVRGTAVRRWDVAGGKELPPLRGHDGGVRTAFFVAEGKFLIVSEDDGKVTRYDVAGLPE